MSVLTASQVNEIINNPTPHPEIAEAVREEQRAKFHTEPVSVSGNSYRTKFLEWVAAIIDKSKLSVFTHLLGEPVPTIDVTESIFNEVGKIFDGQDRFVGYQFVNEQYKTDFEKYLANLDDRNFWRTFGLQALKNSYHSFLVVDLPAIEPEEAKEIEEGLAVMKMPEPYYYLLDISKVLQVSISKVEREVDYIFFLDSCSSEKAYLFDEEMYRAFIKDKKGKWVLMLESPHSLGYTPAKPFWDVPLSSTSTIRKRGLLTNSLSSLDKLLFKIVSESHVELYAEYPIMTTYAQRCDYTDPMGNQCDGGKIRTTMKADMGGRELTETFVDCPKCSGAVRSLGAGSVFEAPAMATSGDPNLIDAVKFVTVPVESLKWVADKVSDLTNRITYSIMGVVDEVSNVAINKDQVYAQYESRQNVLMAVKNRVEASHKWAHETLARLRYGKSFVSVTVNYGTKFFIQTTGQLNESYLKSREAGIPAFELANQRNQIYETKYRSNPEMMQRVRILSNLEPYQDYSLVQIQALSNLNALLDNRMLALKLDFDSYVQRFEREYTDVVSFLQYNDFKQKISVMQEILLGYVDEAMQRNVQPPA